MKFLLTMTVLVLSSTSFASFHEYDDYFDPQICAGDPLSPQKILEIMGYYESKEIVYDFDWPNREFVHTSNTGIQSLKHLVRERMVLSGAKSRWYYSMNLHPFFSPYFVVKNNQFSFLMRYKDDNIDQIKKCDLNGTELSCDTEGLKRFTRWEGTIRNECFILRSQYTGPTGKEYEAVMYYKLY